jgi:transitional endoplasmic reticulum ATPase
MTNISNEDLLEFQDPPSRTLSADVWPDLVDTSLRPLTETRATSPLPPVGARTVLLTGPTGAGKTYLANSILGEVGVPLLEVTPDKTFENHAELRTEVFDRAVAEAPCAIFLEDIDTYEGQSTEFGGEVTSAEYVMGCALEEATRGAGVFVVATATDLSSLDKRIKRPGRFDILCPLSLPDETRRHYLLETFFESLNCRVELNTNAIDELVEMTEGFTPADLNTAVRRARAMAMSVEDDTVLTASYAEQALNSLDRDLDRDPDSNETFLSEGSYDSYYSYDKNLFEEDDEDDYDVLEASWLDDSEDEDDGPLAVSQSSRVPNISYDDIGGLEDAKRILRESVEWPVDHPELAAELDIDPARGILLHGPPGNGKTMLAKAIANETDSQFISVKGPEVMDKYVGESEAFVAEVFESARKLAPAVIFIDEIDSIADERGGGSIEQATDRVVNQLLLELDGLNDSVEVVVIGATNRPDILDEAVHRPGRLGTKIHVPRPDDDTAREIFRVHLSDRPTSDSLSCSWLVNQADEEISGADIAELCEKASREAMRRALSNADKAGPETDVPVVEIGREDFERAFEEPKNMSNEEDASAFQ